MSYTIKEIKQGIKVHCIETKKFKTNLMTVVITLPLNRERVTFNSVIPAVLKRGTENLKTQEEIAKKLEEMYGAEFGCGIEKIGDNHVLKFYLETLNDNFIPKDYKENLTAESINLLLDIIFNPYTENNKFKEEYVEAEKNNIKLLIQAKIDNKDAYALNSCIEEMYKGKPYGLYKYGYIEDLEKINAQNLYEYYKEIIEKAKIDIFFSGDINAKEIEQEVEENCKIKELVGRDAKIIVDKEEKQKQEIKNKEDKMDVTQGKLVIGLDVNYTSEDAKFPISIYNVILGESATSKLFQNVREKASLAYTARSNYVRQKSNIFIRCGIEIENFDKALEIIKKQLEDMKNGDFTEEDLENAKKYMISGITSIQDEQDSEVTYYIGQELSEKFTTFEEYAKKIEKVSMQDVKDVANSIDINTIYFLRN